MDLPSKVLFGALVLILHCYFPATSDDGVKNRYAEDAYWAVCKAEDGKREIMACISYLSDNDKELVCRCMTEKVLGKDYDGTCKMKPLIKDICDRPLELIKEGYYYTCEEREKVQDERTMDENDGHSDFKTCTLKMVEDGRLDKSLGRRR